MKSLSRPAFCGLLLVTCTAIGGRVAHAVCSGPPALMQQMHTHPTADAAVNLGGWYASHHQFDCAVETFRAGLAADPGSAQLHYLTGIALVAEKREREAVPELLKSIELDPHTLKPHIVLASLYEEAGDTDRARAQWKQALTIDPKSEEALDGLSREFIARKDYISTVRLLHNAPRTEKLTIRLAQALGLLDYLDEAQSVLTEAMKAHPDSVPLVSAMTVVLVKSRKYEEATRLLEKAAAAHPNDIEVQVQLYQIQVLTNHINAARVMMPRLLAARPHDPQVLYLSGIVERSTGDYAHARQHLEEAVKLQPDFFNSRYNLGMVLNFLHDWQGAKENLEKAIALGAGGAEVHFELAKALRQLGDSDAAQAEMKKYQEIKKDEESALEAAASAAQGDAAMEQNKLAEAASHYHDATETAPDNAAYRYKYAVALHRAGNTAEEQVQLEQAVKLNPQLAGAQNALGYLLARAGDTANAIEHYKAAVQAAPEWEEAWISLAAEFAIDGQYANARQAAARALEIDPGNAQAKELMSQLERDRNAQTAQP